MGTYWQALLIRFLFPFFGGGFNPCKEFTCMCVYWQTLVFSCGVPSNVIFFSLFLDDGLLGLAHDQKKHSHYGHS
jgi:hypothetical protein